MNQIEIAEQILKQYRYGDNKYNFCQGILCDKCQFKPQCLNCEFSITKVIQWLKYNKEKQKMSEFDKTVKHLCNKVDILEQSVLSWQSEANLWKNKYLRLKEEKIRKFTKDQVGRCYKVDEMEKNHISVKSKNINNSIWHSTFKTCVNTLNTSVVYICDKPLTHEEKMNIRILSIEIGTGTTTHGLQEMGLRSQVLNSAILFIVPACIYPWFKYEIIDRWQVKHVTFKENYGWLND